MNILHLMLDIYFTFALGIAGLAKLDTPHSFASLLRYQYKFPGWSISMIVKFFPWVEILLALSLLLPVYTYKILVTFLLLSLFLFFLAIRLISHWRGLSVKDCGCYGPSIQQSGSDINLATLLIQVILALLLFTTTLRTVTVSWIYYLVCLTLILSFYSWLLRGIWRKHHLQGTKNEFVSPFTSLFFSKERRKRHGIMS